MRLGFAGIGSTTLFVLFFIGLFSFSAGATMGADAVSNESVTLDTQHQEIDSAWLEVNQNVTTDLEEDDSAWVLSMVNPYFKASEWLMHAGARFGHTMPWAGRHAEVGAIFLSVAGLTFWFGSILQQAFWRTKR